MPLRLFHNMHKRVTSIKFSPLQSMSIQKKPSSMQTPGCILYAFTPKKQKRHGPLDSRNRYEPAVHRLAT